MAKLAWAVGHQPCGGMQLESGCKPRHGCAATTGGSGGGCLAEALPLPPNCQPSWEPPLIVPDAAAAPCKSLGRLTASCNVLGEQACALPPARCNDQATHSVHNPSSEHSLAPGLPRGRHSSTVAHSSCIAPSTPASANPSGRQFVEHARAPPHAPRTPAPLRPPRCVRCPPSPGPPARAGDAGDDAGACTDPVPGAAGRAAGGGAVAAPGRRAAAQPAAARAACAAAAAVQSPGGHGCGGGGGGGAGRGAAGGARRAQRAGGAGTRRGSHGRGGSGGCARAPAAAAGGGGASGG